VFTDPDTVREVIDNFNRDGFDALSPRYRGGRPRAFTLPERRRITQIALALPTDLDQPFATWSLAKLADYRVAEGVVTDISHEGLRALLHEEGVRFQALRTWKRSNDPCFETKTNRILELYALADAGEAIVICLDEFGPLNLQPQPARGSGCIRRRSVSARSI
jgi:transposase